MRVVAEHTTALQATVPLNVQMPLLCIPPFTSTHQPATVTKVACHMPRATDLTPNPRGGEAKAHRHRQEQPSATTPLSEITKADIFLSESPSQCSALEATGLTVHSIPVGGGQGFAYKYGWEPVYLMPMEAEDIITIELELQTDVSSLMGLCKSSKYS